MIRPLIHSIYDFYLHLRYGFLERGFLINSHLTMRERVTLYKLASRPLVQTCLEIGSYIGASAFFISAGLSRKERSGDMLFCIDTWNNDAMTEGNKDTFVEFTKNTMPYADFIIPVRGFSTEVVEQVASQTKHLDLLFVDGDHSYEGVKADWEAYRKFLKPGSIVVFHDWGWAEGVKRVVEEDAKQMVSSFGSSPNMWWGEIKA